MELGNAVALRLSVGRQSELLEQVDLKLVGPMAPTLLLCVLLFFFLFLYLAVFFEELFELGDLWIDYVPTVGFLRV